MFPDEDGEQREREREKEKKPYPLVDAPPPFVISLSHNLLRSKSLLV
jgi:hypothetical protein